MSGPAKLRILAIVGVISVCRLNGRLFFTHSTALADLYSRRVSRGLVCLAISGG